MPILRGEFEKIIKNITYKDWVFRVHYASPGFTYLQIEFKDGEEEWQSRKWLLSEHMTDSEIIQTVFKAVMTAEEHEIREKFLYDNVPVLGPHIDLLGLASFLALRIIRNDLREAPQSASQDTLSEKRDSTTTNERNALEWENG